MRLDVGAWRSLRGKRPEGKVVTRQHHLKELGVVECGIAVDVEVLEQVGDVVQTVTAMALLEEVPDVVGVEQAVLVAVNAHKGTVRLELVVGREALAAALNRKLAVSDGHDKVLQLLGCGYRKHK